VDYSSRIQIIDGEFNPEINLSFNLNNKPIVCNILDNSKTFITSDLELLVCENFIIKKKNN